MNLDDLSHMKHLLFRKYFLKQIYIFVNWLVNLYKFAQFEKRNFRRKQLFYILVVNSFEF